MNVTIPQTINSRLFATMMLLHTVILFLLPSVATPAPVWIGTLALMAWLTIIHWALIHEAIHKLLFKHPRMNDIAGRILAIAMGTSFHVLRFGHLMHHQFNRHFQSEIIERPTFGAKFYYYCYLVFGLYLSELVTGLMFAFLPRRWFMRIARATFLKGHENVAVIGERFFYERGNIIPTRIDVYLGLVLYAAAFYLAGAAWVWLASFIALRAFVISFMDNIYHFDTPADNSKAAKELYLPPLLSAAILHGNLHETHHLNPNLPWTALPLQHAVQSRNYDGSFATHGWMQFAGPTARNAHSENNMNLSYAV